MSELDMDALEGVRAWAQKRIDWRERQVRMEPLHEAISIRGELLMTALIPDIMAGPTADSRRSVLRLETSAAEWPQRRAEMEARLEGQLARARRRTAALRAWLEALS